MACTVRCVFVSKVGLIKIPFSTLKPPHSEWLAGSRLNCRTCMQTRVPFSPLAVWFWMTRWLAGKLLKDIGWRMMIFALLMMGIWRMTGKPFFALFAKNLINFKFKLRVNDRSEKELRHFWILNEILASELSKWCGEFLTKNRHLVVSCWNFSFFCLDVTYTQHIRK